MDAAFYPLSSSGLLRVAGEDRLAFLQRQTSNDVRRLSEQGLLLTALTSPTGRILDVLCLLHEAQALTVLTLPGCAARTTQYLQRRIFFMDKVTVEECSQDFIQYEVLGRQADDALQSLGAVQFPEVGQALAFAWQEVPAQLLKLETCFSLGYRLLVPAKIAEMLEAALTRMRVARLDDLAFNLLRVEAGLPAAGAELIEQYTPFEVGLAAIVSSTKGCYTGQEVLARQLSYDRITQRLCGLRLEMEAEASASLSCQGRPAGKLTSVVHSPHLGWIGLAVVRHPYDEAGAALQVGLHGTLGRVVELPF